MIKKILLSPIVILLYINTSVAQINPSHSSISWVLGIKDSLNYRNKQISIGTGWSITDIDINDSKTFNSNVLNVNFKLGYEDIYSLKFNNPYKFINYRGIQLYASKDVKQFNLNILDSDNFEYGLRLISGVGYNFDNFQLIPYTVGGIVRNSLKFENKDGNVYSKNLGGKNSEIGLMIKLPFSFGFSIAYNNTIYNKEASYIKKITSSLVEVGTMYAFKKLLYSLKGDSPLYPVLYFMSQSAIRFMFIGLRRDKSNFPFEGNPFYSTDKFQFTFNYNLSF